MNLVVKTLIISAQFFLLKIKKIVISCETYPTKILIKEIAIILFSNNFVAQRETTYKDQQEYMVSQIFSFNVRKGLSHGFLQR